MTGPVEGRPARVLAAVESLGRNVRGLLDQEIQQVILQNRIVEADWPDAGVLLPGTALREAPKYRLPANRRSALPVQAEHLLLAARGDSRCESAARSGELAFGQG